MKNETEIKRFIRELEKERLRVEKLKGVDYTLNAIDNRIRALKWVLSDNIQV